MLTETKQLYAVAKSTHNDLYEMLKVLESKFAEGNLASQVDMCYGLKKTSEMLTDIRKQIDKLNKRLCMITAMSLIAEQADSFKTEYVTVKPKVDQVPKFPAKRQSDPDKYDALMKDMGLPQSLIETEAMRPHWPGMKEWFTHRQMEGLPLPAGINPDDIFTEYDLGMRKLREVDE